MKPLDRDRSILEHILSYCAQIETTMPIATAPSIRK